MNYSDLSAAVYAYLGFRGVGRDADTDALIGECLKELETLCAFRYRYARFTEFPPFLKQEPYRAYLAGCNEVLVSVMTLGAVVDRRTAYYSRANMVKSVVFDAAASAYLEALSDQFEAELSKELNIPFTPRFCPGYGGSDISDVRRIFEILPPEQTGVTLTESNYMLPSKSMAGVIGMGKTGKKSCGNCFLLPHCVYRKEGRRCYDWAEK